MSFGTNLGSATSPVSPTLWIRETDPTTQNPTLALSAVCTGVPPTTANVFQRGCTIVRVDATLPNPSMYINTGTSAAPVWTASSFLETSVTLTAAQINALNTTPITLVAAPGAGLILDNLGAILKYTYGTVAFTIGSATNLNINYTNAAGAATGVNLAVTGFIDQASNQYRTMQETASNITPVANAPLVLSLAGGNPADGDGTLTVTVQYRVIAG